MKSKMITFTSGLRLVYKYLPSVRSVGISILTATGSNNETAENNGISHFIEHMFFKGTSKRSSFEIVDAVDSLGAQINAFTSKLSTCFYTLSIDTQSEQCAEILSDIMFNSQFDKDEMEKEKGVVLEEISMSSDDNSDLVIDVLEGSYFKGNSLGRTILGTRDNVKNFSRQDLVDYIAENYCAKDTVIAIVGNIEIKRARDIVEKYFEGRFREKCERNWADTPHETKSEYLYQFKDIEQSNIALATPSYRFASDLDMALMLVNNIVGGGMSSRLFQEIREKQGLAYNVYTYPSTYINNGVMTLYIGTNPQSVEKSLVSSVELIKNLQKNGLSQKEFEKGVQQLKGAYVLGQESTAAQIRVFAKYALYSNELFDFDKMLTKIDKIKFSDVNKVVSEVFDLSKASVAYIGREIKTDLLSLIK